MTGTRTAGVLVAVAAVLLAATVVSAYAWRALFDPDQFADRAASALQDARVRDAIAERVTDDLVLSRNPDLLAGRPIIASTVGRIVGGDVFAALLRRSARDVHAAVLRSEQDTVVLTLADVGVVVGAALDEIEPALAAGLRSQGAVVLSRRLGSATAGAARLAEQVRWIALALAALTLVAAVTALAVSGDRRRTARRLGVSVAVAGVAIVAAEVIARALVLGSLDDPGGRAAAAGVWEAFLGDLRWTGWTLAGAGAVVAAAAASLIRPVALETPLRGVLRAITLEPRTPLLRGLRGAALILAGVLLIAEPAAAVRIAATSAGVYALYKGLEALLRLIPPPEPGARPARRTLQPRRLVAPGLAAVLIGCCVALLLASGGVSAPAPPVTRCNGHAELCDRPLDEVVLPATHNAMSVPLPGWFAALQERPIAGQLEDGIRGLLLDTHYADRLPNGRTRTYFADAAAFRSAIQQDGVSESSVRAAQRLRDRLGFRGGGERGMYLCHTFCELGATPLEDVLDEIREFLVTHPGEILAVVNQDFVTPEDFVGAMEEAELSRLAFAPPARGPWPTLGELVERDRRLVVLAENRAGAAPWYQLAYGGPVQETPFTFSSPSELTAADQRATCEANRGTPEAPLFLLNHWINTDPAPRPSHAELVNAYEPLLHRARSCARLRGQVPNLLAVDFYARGDVFAVADTLNQIGPGREDG